MRIYLKTISPDGAVSQQDLGFVALRSLLQQKSPLVGLSVESDEDTGGISATHYLYELSEDGLCIKRYPLSGFANQVAVIKDYTRTKSITDPFTKPDENIEDAGMDPVLPNDVEQYFFSETEKETVLSPIRDCFSRISNDVFPDQSSLVIRSILTTLFSAGFITHPAWPDNLTLLLKNKNKLEEIASALFALHETGLLTQKTFLAVVNHTTPWKCASGLRYLTDYRTDKHKVQIRLIPYRRAQKIESDLFDKITIFIQDLGNKFLSTIVSHPFPEEISRIIALLYHVFGSKIDLTIVDAIASIKEKFILNYLGSTLFGLHQRKLLTKENCFFLLKESDHPIRFQHILYTINEKLGLLCIQIDNKSLRHLLSITTAQEFEEKSRRIMEASEAEIQSKVDAIYLQKEKLCDQSIKIIHKSGLFSLRRAHLVSMTGNRNTSDTVTPVLEQLVFGEESAVKTKLDAVKKINELNRLLCNTSTATDYSGRQITDTLFKAALRAGDVEMCEMLMPYFDLIPEGKKELEIQFLEIFPDGIKEKYKELEEDSKRDFEPMLQAATQAIFNDPDPSNPNDHINDLDATLNKDINNSLYQKLETLFRKPFEALSKHEKIFNPYHYLRVLEVYNELWNQCVHDKSDPQYKKRDLFWRQIIGFIQRFMPACYAQAFAQGLGDLVNVDSYNSAGWVKKSLNRDLVFRFSTNFSCFPLESRARLGFDFAIHLKFFHLTFGGVFVSEADNHWKPNEMDLDFFKNFYQSKIVSFQNIMARVRAQSTYRKAEAQQRFCTLM